MTQASCARGAAESTFDRFETVALPARSLSLIR